MTECLINDLYRNRSIIMTKQKKKNNKYDSDDDFEIAKSQEQKSSSDGESLDSELSDPGAPESDLSDVIVTKRTKKSNRIYQIKHVLTLNIF